ncbi:MAG TPA: methyltransferase domain-containing protein [Nocardioidaceae bacterium]|nr:methyltransferase domain-containing protein [Nocardioidaceae bacterium]
MATMRSAVVYADFLSRHLTDETDLVDVGCGAGELTLELASAVRHVTGVDSDPSEVQQAQRTAQSIGVDNAVFAAGNAYALPLPDDGTDVVFGHSVLEALDHPAEALTEMKRVLKPGGVLAVASVEYEGLILAGPNEELVRRFFDIRTRLWQSEGADPYLGRRLRGLLHGVGMVSVEATTKCISYGTKDAVVEFGLGRADDCMDDWFAGSANRDGLATADDLTAIRQAWLDWSESPDSYAAFAWCRALGQKPHDA